MVLSIGERIKGFLFSPSETFDASKEDTLGDAFKYFIVLLLIYAVLSAIVIAVAFSLIGGMMGAFLPGAQSLGAGLGALAAVIVFIAVLIGGIIGVFIGGLWLHLWVYLLGGKKGIEQTIKVVMYGSTPSLLLGWIPIVNYIVGIWALIVEIIGIRQLHELSTGKAILAVIIAIVIPIILYLIVLVAIIATIPTGPGYGGF